MYSVGKDDLFFTGSVSKIQFSMSSKRKNMYLLTKCEGQTENIWLEIMTYRPSAATCQI